MSSAKASNTAGLVAVSRAAAMASQRDRLRLLWRLLRITDATYFVLGTDATAHLRLRVDSAWDWMQAYELRSLEVAARPAGQPEVASGERRWEGRWPLRPCARPDRRANALRAWP